jgi:RNA polymerase sigma-70 factor (ECF subfamily)
MDPTNPSLILRAKEGEEAAWVCIANIYSPFIEHWLRKWEAREEADLRQEVLLRAWRGLNSFQIGNGGSFRGWLLVITRNVVRDQFAKAPPAVGRGGSEFAARIAQLPDHVLYEEADSPLPEREEVELMRRAVQALKAQLSESAWKVFWEASVKGRSSTEIAGELQMTPAAVRRAKSRALNQLRQLLYGLMPDAAASLV